VANSDIKVVGIEKKSNFVQSANKRQEKSDQGCKNILLISYYFNLSKSFISISLGFLLKFKVLLQILE